MCIHGAVYANACLPAHMQARAGLRTLAGVYVYALCPCVCVCVCVCCSGHGCEHATLSHVSKGLCARALKRVCVCACACVHACVCVGVQYTSTWYTCIT